MPTQLPRVPSLIPSSFATLAIGRDVSITIFTASSLNSGEKLFFGRGNYFTFPDAHPIGWTVRKARGTSQARTCSGRPRRGRTRVAVSWAVRVSFGGAAAARRRGWPAVRWRRCSRAAAAGSSSLVTRLARSRAVIPVSAGWPRAAAAWSRRDGPAGAGGGGGGGGGPGGGGGVGEGPVPREARGGSRARASHPPPLG